MLELALVLVGVLGVGLIGGLAATVTPGVMAGTGLAILLLGLAIGVPTGLWYHVVLYRIVSARAPLPRTWWVTPSSLHHHLTSAEHRRVSSWYRIGGVGFVFCLIGGLTAIAASLLWLWRP